MPCSKMALTPSKAPEPAARQANSSMPQQPVRLQMVPWVVHSSRVQACSPASLENNLWLLNRRLHVQCLVEYLACSVTQFPHMLKSKKHFSHLAGFKYTHTPRFQIVLQQWTNSKSTNTSHSSSSVFCHTQPSGEYRRSVGLCLVLVRVARGCLLPLFCCGWRHMTNMVTWISTSTWRVYCNCFIRIV